MQKITTIGLSQQLITTLQHPVLLFLAALISSKKTPAILTEEINAINLLNRNVKVTLWKAYSQIHCTNTQKSSQKWCPIVQSYRCDVNKNTLSLWVVFIFVGFLFFCFSFLRLYFFIQMKSWDLKRRLTQGHTGWQQQQWELSMQVSRAPSKIIITGQLSSEGIRKSLMLGEKEVNVLPITLLI